MHVIAVNWRALSDENHLKRRKPLLIVPIVKASNEPRSQLNSIRYCLLRRKSIILLLVGNQGARGRCCDCYDRCRLRLRLRTLGRRHPS